MILHDIFRAGRVRRWHTNPDLAHTSDPIDGHSGRVVRIILALHPDPSVDLIRAAASHDDGEIAIGDVRAPAKDAHPELAKWLEEQELAARTSIWGDDPDLSIVDMLWLRFADRLDAYMWARTFAPAALSGDGWPESFAWLSGAADELVPHFGGADVISFLKDEQGA